MHRGENLRATHLKGWLRDKSVEQVRRTEDQNHAGALHGGEGLVVEVGEDGVDEFAGLDVFEWHNFDAFEPGGDLDQEGGGVAVFVGGAFEVEDAGHIGDQEDAASGPVDQGAEVDFAVDGGFWQGDEEDLGLFVGLEVVEVQPEGVGAKVGGELLAGNFPVKFEKTGAVTREVHGKLRRGGMKQLRQNHTGKSLTIGKVRCFHYLFILLSADR